jgi:hypothetical protein
MILVSSDSDEEAAKVSFANAPCLVHVYSPELKDVIRDTFYVFGDPACIIYDRNGKRLTTTGQFDLHKDFSEWSN